MTLTTLCCDAIVSSIRRAASETQLPRAVFLSPMLIDEIGKEALDHFQFDMFPEINIVADYNLLGITCYCFSNAPGGG